MKSAVRVAVRVAGSCSIAGIGFLCTLLMISAARADVLILPEVVEVDLKHPTLVDLDLKDVTSEQAFDAACKFSIVPTRVDVWQGDRNKTFSLKLTKTPFAQALLQIARKAGVSLYRFNGYCNYQTMPLQNGTESWTHGDCVNEGPFCGILEQINFTRSIALSDPKAVSRSLQLTMKLLPEPQVVIYSDNPWLVLPSVKDENDRLLKDQVSNHQQIRHPSENIHSTTGILDVPPEAGNQLKSISAKRELQIVTRFRQIEISEDELVNGTTFSTDGLTVELEKPKNKQNFGKQFAMKVTFDPAVHEKPEPNLIRDGVLCAMLDESYRPMRTLWRNNDSVGKDVSLLYSFCPMPQDGRTVPWRMVLLLPLTGADVAPAFQFGPINLNASPR